MTWLGLLLLGASLEISSPAPRQVIQRTGMRFGEPNALGSGRVTIAATADAVLPAEGWEARAVPVGRAFGRGCDWTKLPATVAGQRVELTLEVPAGGWYRLEVRSGDFTGVVEPVGVGDLFIVAGQSYASNTGEERLRVDDPEGRVVAYDLRRGTWQVAHDPQPSTTPADGGTPWPALMNLLLPVARVPVGMVNVAVGGTSVRQWLPGEELVSGERRYRMFDDLVTAGQTLGRFRAVLWQQGESDVIDKTTAPVYQERLRRIVTTAAEKWGFHPPWLLAKSTCHPTVYVRPEQEGVIRGALEGLLREPDFLRGPDTDQLCEVGLYRAPMGTRRHFAPAGQRAAGSLWFAAIWSALYQ